MNKIIQINPTDNVAVAIKDLRKGDKIRINLDEIILKDDIPVGHKIALDDLKEEIGRASCRERV